ncbi:MAG: MarR family winged helix-turn-helix transcriptional regulator [Ilumatobacteraceae bacterium]
MTRAADPPSDDPTGRDPAVPVDPIELARRNWVDAGWSDAADGMMFVTSLVRAQQLVLARIEDLLRPHGLTFARFEVLRLLAFTRHGVLPVGKVGERLQVHPASVTNAVHRLEAAGLVARSANPADGRSVLVAITPDGRRLVESCTQLLNAQVFTRLPLDAAAHAEATAALGSLRRGFGDPVT